MSNEIVFVTTEAAPLAKTGGLADVCGSLPRALNATNLDCSVVLPWWRNIDGDIVETHMVSLSGRELKITVGKTSIGDVPVYLVGHPPLFHREELYGEGNRPYPDNARRFILFSKAAIRVAEEHCEPDLYHCHDWFTGAVPMLLNYGEHGPDRPSVFTIHNLRHQGRFSPDSYRYLELPWEHFRFDTVEYYGELNLMKGGITQADRLTTVSPTYAREIQTEKFGEGLHNAIRDRSNDLTGILNGIDPDTWHPETDEYLEEDERYSTADLAGKNRVRDRLLDNFPDGIDRDQPLIGMVGRIVPQKGFNLLIRAWEALANRPARWIILGTGEGDLEDQLREKGDHYPEQLHTIIDFDERMAHRIEAGADLFCMPSRFEPCGLNQMYSMQYGTVPVVYETGGLADTVRDPISDGKTATGFCFDEYSPEALVETVDRAVDCYLNERETWDRLRQNGMTHDWSWAASAQQYRELYKEVLP